MSRIIAALLIALLSAPLAAGAAQSKPLELAADAPERHVVVKGDTLWGIASKFLKDPLRWSEIWRMNPAEIKNPHRIYPGQVIVLDKSDGSPHLMLVTEKLAPRIREEETSQEIPAIPQSLIEPLLSRPLIVDEKMLAAAPRIVGAQDGRTMGGKGDLIYAVNLGEDKSRKWLVYRAGAPLVDPVSKEVLGNDAVVIGSALLRKTGDPATLVLTSATSEIAEGDRLMPTPQADIVSYPQRMPDQPINGSVIVIPGGAPSAGLHSVVAISRGARDGLELGHVLAAYQPGARFTDRGGEKARELQTPDERVALLYLFKVFDRVSYALVMQATRGVSVGDAVRNP